MANCQSSNERLFGGAVVEMLEALMARDLTWMLDSFTFRPHWWISDNKKGRHGDLFNVFKLPSE